jgi:hypothetical protein
MSASICTSPSAAPVRRSGSRHRRWLGVQKRPLSRRLGLPRLATVLKRRPQGVDGHFQAREPTSPQPARPRRAAASPRAAASRNASPLADAGLITLEVSRRASRKAAFTPVAPRHRPFPGRRSCGISRHSRLRARRCGRAERKSTGWRRKDRKSRRAPLHRLWRGARHGHQCSDPAPPG